LRIEYDSLNISHSERGHYGEKMNWIDSIDSIDSIISIDSIAERE